MPPSTRPHGRLYVVLQILAKREYSGIQSTSKTEAFCKRRAWTLHRRAGPKRRTSKGVGYGRNLRNSDQPEARPCNRSPVPGHDADARDQAGQVLQRERVQRAAVLAGVSAWPTVQSRPYCAFRSCRGSTRWEAIGSGSHPAGSRAVRTVSCATSEAGGTEMSIPQAFRISRRWR